MGDGMKYVLHYGLKPQDLAQGMRTRIQYKQDLLYDFRAKTLVAIIVSLAIAVAVACGLWYVLNSTNGELVEEKVKVSHYSGLLASAMNGDTLYDFNSNTAYFFDKPTPVRLGEK